LITSVVSWARVQGEFMMYKTIYSRLAADWWQMNESSKAALAVGYTHDPVGQPLNWYCGTALLNSDKIMEAKKYFVASLKQNPYHFETWNDLGSCYERLNNIDSARICFKRNLQFAPKYPRSLFNLGVLFYQEKKYDSALIYMQQYPFGYTSNNYLELKKALTDSLQKRKIKN
jgi:tetratricopeptide (TPR) repeat protein